MFNKSFSNFSISNSSGVESNNTLKISLATGIEKLTANTVNNIDKIGSKISHYGFKYIIKDTITTPRD